MPLKVITILFLNDQMSSTVRVRARSRISVEKRPTL